MQDNQSQSSCGTLRRLHFQKAVNEQAKLIRLLTERLLGVVVGLRPKSLTFKKSYSIKFSSEKKKQQHISRGVANGFLVFSEKAEFFYKSDNYYNPKDEGGILFSDPDLNIDWKTPSDQLFLSDKDKKTHNQRIFKKLKGTNYYIPNSI